jgi:hypothetical protein
MLRLRVATTTQATEGEYAEYASLMFATAGDAAFCAMLMAM